jgi:hypothetical protein
LHDVERVMPGIAACQENMISREADDRCSAPRLGSSVPGTNVNVWDVNARVQEWIRQRRRVDPRVLANPRTPLDAIVSV